MDKIQQQRTNKQQMKYVIRNTVSGNEKEEKTIIRGINDYLSEPIKWEECFGTFKILIIGNISLIISEVLWNEIYGKTLLKQAYSKLLQATKMQSLFIKINEGTVQLIDNQLEWWGKRKLKLNQKNPTQKITIQGFNQHGISKKIIIDVINSYSSQNKSLIGYNAIYQYDRDQKQLSLSENIKLKNKIKKESIDSTKRSTERQIHTQRKGLKQTINKENKETIKKSVQKTRHNKSTKNIQTQRDKQLQTNFLYNTQKKKIQQIKYQVTSKDKVLSRLLQSKNESLLNLQKDNLEMKQLLRVKLSNQQLIHQQQLNKIKLELNGVLKGYEQRIIEMKDKNNSLLKYVELLQASNAGLKQITKEKDDQISKKEKLVFELRQSLNKSKLKQQQQSEQIVILQRQLKEHKKILKVLQAENQQYRKIGDIMKNLAIGSVSIKKYQDQY